MLPHLVTSEPGRKRIFCLPASSLMAEWSKAPDPSSGLFGGVGSNPTPVSLFGDLGIGRPEPAEATGHRAG